MAFTASQIILILIISIILIIGLILGLKQYFKFLSTYLTEKYNKQVTPKYLKKYSEANVFKLRSTFLGLGFLCSLSFVLLIINWIDYNEYFDYSCLCRLYYDTEIELEIPRTYPEPVPPPPPPISDIEEDELLEDMIDFDEIDNYENELIDLIPNEEISNNTTIEEEIFTVVEDMPCFPGCEDLPTNDERRKCTETNLLKFISRNIKIPSIARENGIAGLVAVTFIIDKDGNITRTECLKDIGGGVGDQAVRIIKMMNDMPTKWTPGKQNGKNVNVRYNLPIRICLRQN